MTSRRRFLRSFLPLIELSRQALGASEAGPLKFIVFGDSGSGTEEQLQLVPHMRLERPDLAIHTGDLAYPLGTVEAYLDLYFAPYRELMESIPFYPCPGNHDYVDDRPEAYRALMRVPKESVPADGLGLFYSFDAGGVHFLSLDTNTPLEKAVTGRGPMLEWLEADLRRAGTLWKVAFFHHTPYATGPHEASSSAALVRRHVVPVLEKHGVQVVFAGHEHSYQRSHPIRGGSIDPARGTIYITTGGGGGGLYPAPAGPFQALGLSRHHFVSAEVDGPRMHLRAITGSGEQLDAVTLTAG